VNSREARLIEKYGNNRIVTEIVAVHQNYQRKGIGSMLLDYGIGYAKKHRLALYNLSTIKGAHLYARKGMICTWEGRMYPSLPKQKLFELYSE